jgi:hypothetical protein
VDEDMPRLLSPVSEGWRYPANSLRLVSSFWAAIGMVGVAGKNAAARSPTATGRWASRRSDKGASGRVGFPELVGHPSLAKIGTVERAEEVLQGLFAARTSQAALEALTGPTSE